ncbi:MAG: ParB/RepB/Spo0J family partition protein [Syntrophales bacterium]
MYEKGKLYDLPIIDLKPDPNQPRKSMDPQGLEELKASIKTHGIIQPILFRQGDGDTLIIVAGERRFAAAQMADLPTVPCICVEGNPSEIALVENLLRQDLTSVEEAEALQRLMTEQQYNQEQMGVVIGKARTTIGDILTLNKLPQFIRDECRGDRQITRATLIEIARKKQERSMTTAYNAYRARQQKGKTSRQQKDPNEPQALLDTVNKTTTKLQSLDTSAWTEENKTGFRTALTGLKTEVDNYLAAQPPTTKKSSKKLM